MKLEFNGRLGGRNWTLRGGDTFVELGGARQTCAFEDGLYLNPGPRRISYHHRALRLVRNRVPCSGKRGESWGLFLFAICRLRSGRSIV